MRGAAAVTAIALALALPVAPSAADERLACPENTLTRETRTALGVERWCERPGPPAVRHGPYVVTHPEGGVHLRGEYSEGVATGAWKTWYRGGAQSGEAQFRGGRTTGMLLGWYENGRGSFVCGFRDGVAMGRMELFDSDGRLRQAADYDNAGVELRREAWDEQGRSIDPQSPDADRAGKTALQTSVLIDYGFMASTLRERRR
jgi:hypothetical protein